MQLNAAVSDQLEDEAAEIPQLDGGDAEEEEVVRIMYQFEHQKGRGDKTDLEKNMREAMPINIVRDILLKQREETYQSWERNITFL